MMISTKGRYALRVIIDMVQNQNDDYIPLREIAERQEISPKYLEAIVNLLSKAGIVEGMRGKGGGYKLSKDPDDITVGDILKMTEGSLAPVACLECGAAECNRAENCLTLPMWEKLDGMIDEYFSSITITDLADGKLE